MKTDNVVQFPAIAQIKHTNKLLLKTLKLHNNWLGLYMGKMDISGNELDHLIDLYENTQAIIEHAEKIV